MPAVSPSITGLAVGAGGARGAHQAGVLKRIAEIPAVQDRPSPFQVVAGASAGAIDGAMVAGHSSGFGMELLARRWSQLTAADVFRTDTISMARNAGRLAADFAPSQFTGAGRVQPLVDTAPLRRFLRNRLPLAGIADAIRLLRWVADEGGGPGRAYRLPESVRINGVHRRTDGELSLPSTLSNCRGP